MHSHASLSSCCENPSALDAENKGCCTDQVDWEPSQLDLAFADQSPIEGFSPSGFPVLINQTSNVFVIEEVQRPYVRPPPPIPIVQTRRRALTQVYRC
jgi:hypothetical protein